MEVYLEVNPFSYCHLFLLSHCVSLDIPEQTIFPQVFLAGSAFGRRESKTSTLSRASRSLKSKSSVEERELTRARALYVPGGEEEGPSGERLLRTELSPNLVMEVFSGKRQKAS